MSWMTGFERGQRIAKGLMDTFQQAKQQGEIEKIVNDKPVEETGLTTDQNEQVFQELADGGTARDVKNEDGSFGGVAVTKPLADGVEGPAQVKTLEPQKITKYLGKEFVGGLDPAKATSLRNRALAGVITRFDPLQGIKLDAALTQTEREEQDYGDKQQVRTLQRQFTAERDPLKRAEIGRQLAALPGGGDVVKGFGDIEQANYRAVVNHARGFLAKGDVKGAMNVYNQYDNGEDGEVVELPGGGYQLNFYQGKPGDGQPTGSKSFGSLDELNTWFSDQFDPEAALKRKAEAAAKQAELRTWQAKEDYQQQGRIALEDRKAGRLRAGYKWSVDPETGEEIQVRADGGGGSSTSSGGGKKAPATPADAASSLFIQSIKEAASQFNTLTPAQISAGDAAARAAISLNPGIRPEIAASAGMAFASAQPGSTVFSWDPATNSAVEQVQTPQGLVAVNQVTHRNATARQMPPEKLKMAVESSINSLTGGDPAKRQKVVAAAFDTTGQARRALLEDAKAELMAMQQFKALSPQGKAEALRAHELNVDRALAVPLGWIRNFGQGLNK